MSVNHLPEDVRRWPRDPYQLLGVAPGCDAGRARKAYTGLIRHFKPEQYPEQFRLIREAYDAIKRQHQFLGAFHQATGDTTEQSEAKTSAPGTAAHDEMHAVAMSDPLPPVWELACAGKETEAYLRLREMLEIAPQDSNLAARLYSLLLANPELDPLRTPCDWLVRGVRAEGPWGACRQLYRREIDDHPQEALSERFVCLLGAVTPPRNVLDLLAARWEALTRLGKTELIAADLERVAPRLEREDEEGWVRVLLKAADYLAWQEHGNLNELREEIDSHVHVHAALGEDLSRLDFLCDISGSWHKLQANNWTDASLLKVLPLSWTSPFENRHRILLQCRTSAENPEGAMAQLDKVHRQAPLISAHLGQTMSWLWPAISDPRDAAAMSSAIVDRLGGMGHPVSENDYVIFRRHLLQVCVSELIAPESVPSMLSHDGTTFFWQRVLDDWPLRVVCMAHRAIWM